MRRSIGIARFLWRSVITAVLGLSLTLPGMATTIDLTIDFTPPPWAVGPTFHFQAFQAPFDAWATLLQPLVKGPAIGEVGGPLPLGTSEYEVSVLPTDPFSETFMILWGDFFGAPPPPGPSNPPFVNVFVASQGGVSSELAFLWGPPWISLGHLDPGLTVSGDLRVILGHAQPEVVGTWELRTAPIPEPSTLLLVGSALAGWTALGRRSRRS